MASAVDSSPFTICKAAPAAVGTGGLEPASADHRGSPQYRLLARKHVEIEWPMPRFEHRLGEDEPFEAKFAARLRCGDPGRRAADGIHRTPGLRPVARADFAPVVFLLLQDAPGAAPEAPRLHRLYGRRIDRDRLIRTITTASHEQKKALTAFVRVRISSSSTNSDHDHPRPPLHTAGRLGRMCRYWRRASAPGRSSCSRCSARCLTYRSASSASTVSCRNTKSSPSQPSNIVRIYDLG